MEKYEGKDSSICVQMHELSMVKAKHQRLLGLLNPMDIPKWKSEKIAMDFVVGFPRSARGHNTIWVIVDQSTKFAYFLPVRQSSAWNSSHRYMLERFS